MPPTQANWPTGDEDEAEASAAPVVVAATESPAVATTQANQPVVAPVFQQQVSQVAPARKEPATIKEALDAIAAAQALTARSSEQQDAKAAAIQAATKAYHRVCSGDTDVPMTIGETKELFDAQSVAAEVAHIETLSRQFPVVKKLAAEVVELRALLKLAK